MTSLLALIKGKALLALAGVGGAALATILLKIIPKMVGKYAASYLDRALDMKDPKDRELVLSLVKWAEYKIPDKGMGQERYKAVASKIVKMFPIMAKYEVRISYLIEDSVNQMDKQLKEASKKK